MSFANQVAVVTGASSGIGWELAKALASDGAKVGIIARRRDKLDDLSGEIRKSGGTVASVAADVGDRPQLQDAVTKIERELGPIDLLVANAGVAPSTYWEPFNTADVENIFRINLMGVVYSVEAVLPTMLARGRGHIAAVSSVAAYRPLPGEAAYCASKAAVNTFMESLRLDLRSRGITITTICPGFVRTPMTAANSFHMPWLLEPADAAQRILKGLKRRKKVVDFPRRLAWLLKLSRLMPDWFMVRYMGRNYPINPQSS